MAVESKLLKRSTILIDWDAHEENSEDKEVALHYVNEEEALDDAEDEGNISWEDSDASGSDEEGNEMAEMENY